MAKLSNVSISKTDLTLIGTAFLAYTGMYAVRKSFLAGQFEGVEMMNDFHFKTILIISQVLGYMLSKFLGIRVVSALPAGRRMLTLIGLVGFGLLALVGFAVAPPVIKPLMMFLNGLPLGMVFGLVLVYLEGRKNSELLVAGLSATFIFSTGLIKSTGIWMMQDFGVAEGWMPLVTGLVFFPWFVAAVYGLDRCKGPSEEDRQLRTERRPMKKADRRDFLNRHGWAFLGLVLMYVVLTVVRDFRDNFIVEFWAELGMKGNPELITLTEVPIALVVLLISALGILVLDNKKAFNLGMVLTLVSGGLMVLTTLLFDQGLVGSITWMISSGFCVYLPYILFHCLIFERFVAVLKYKGTVEFLFYIADAFGYLASVAIMLYKELMTVQLSWVGFFTRLNLVGGWFMVLLVAISVLMINTDLLKEKIQKLYGASAKG